MFQLKHSKPRIITSASAIVMAAMLQIATADHSFKIEVVGLLGEKAVLRIDGRQHILPIGKASPEGVKLVSIEAEGVTVEIDGRRESYRMGDTAIGTNYEKPVHVTEQVFKDTSGMFRATGTINGYPVNFLVDTGATTVAMNSNEARRLGIQYELNGIPGTVMTAGGTAQAYKVKLTSVSVGRIKLSNIDAVVIKNTQLDEVLLGMSFLGRLNVQHKDTIMLLETKY
jgi:aspartyl protease family protein